MKVNLLQIGIPIVALVALPSISPGQASAQDQSSGQIGIATSAAGSRSAADVLSGMKSTSLTAIPQDFANMKLAPGFLLNVKVLYDQDFDGSYRIDQGGSIVLPELGAIHVAGDTASEARAQVAKMLVDARLMKEPQVTLEILEYAAPEVTILGEVAVPGKYPLLVPHKLTDVLGLAGGTTITAASEIQITRSGSGEQMLVHYSRNSNLQSVSDVIVHPGDTVFVKRAGIVYVLGGVMRPGGYVMQEQGSLSVLEAVALANGTSLPASIHTVYILRKNSDGSEIYISVPYNKITHGKDSDFTLRASDVLYVPTNKFKSALLGGGAGILAAVSSASIYAATVY